MMKIKKITMYKCSDGEIFETHNCAYAHQNSLISKDNLNKRCPNLLNEISKMNKVEIITILDYIKDNFGDVNEQLCDYCKSDVDVIWTTDPYNSEINGDIRELHLCKVCYTSILEL